jgi:flagellar biosynthesis protein FliQ
MYKLEQMQNPQNGSTISILIGSIMAIFNHLFGWMNQIQPTSHIPSLVQALLMGIVGALGTFIGNEAIKFVKKIVKKKHENIY